MRAVTSLLRRAMHWPLYRLRLRAPRLAARIQAELPLRPVPHITVEAERSSAVIPNVVHQTWIGNRFGRRHVRELERIRAENADFSFRFYDEAAIEAFMAAHFADHPIIEVFRGARFGPLKADIWRYCVLERLGGIYLDIGKGIGIPFRELIPPAADAVISWEARGRSPLPVPPAAAAVLDHPNRVMINWALMFAPGHPLLRRAIDGIVAKYPAIRGVVSAEPKLDILRFTGPVHLTECLLASAAAGELENADQAGIEFEGTGSWGVPGAWVRYIDQPPYELARYRSIVD